MQIKMTGFLAAALLAGAGVAAADDQEYRLVLENHRFEPAELAVPSGQKIKLIVQNKDPTPEEFESHSLHREKIVPANGTIVVNVGPLQPGRYEFVGEFNEKTARGWIVAAP